MKKTVLILLLFTSLLLFSSTSLAHIPGDFNQDGKVDFEDLMIFALAYGSTPSSSNWDARCDLEQDNRIDFEDLMIFAMNYGKTAESKIDYFKGYAYTGHSTRSASHLPEMEHKASPMIHRYPGDITGDSIARGGIYNAIDFTWNGYYDCEGFRIYRSVNGSAYQLIFDWYLPGENITPDYYFGAEDRNISPGNTYTYYVTAYNNTENWETSPSDTFTITIGNKTFLLAVYLIQPPDNSTIDDPEYLFQWTPIGDILPYGNVVSGETWILIYDAVTYSTVMSYWYDGFTLSKKTYDGVPLIPGRTYRWYVHCYGYDSEGSLTSYSESERWEFTYEGELLGISDIYATAITYQATDRGKLQSKMQQDTKRKGKDIYHLNQLPLPSKGITGHYIEVEWDFYPNVPGFKIYRSVNGGNWVLYDDWTVPPGYYYYIFYDDNVSEGNSYSYYVTAYGPGCETNPSPEVTIDTWLPPCSLLRPEDNSNITEPTPTFAWNPAGVSAPSGSIKYFRSDLWVYDRISGSASWRIWFDDVVTDTQVYNSDGRANPLVSGHEYYWNSWAYGYDEDWNLIAISESEDWDFDVNIASSTVRRALLVGVGDYINPDVRDLLAPPYNVNMVKDTLHHSGNGFERIDKLTDWQATKSAILNGITSTFSGADDDDVSYFFFNGHGASDGGASYLVPTDAYYPSDLISVDELEIALNAIPGTKVVFIEACHSGGFIGKGINENGTDFNPEDFNRNVIDAFVSRDLAGTKYQVLTSCLSTQVCWELYPSTEDPFGLFTGVLCTGCGYNYYSHPYEADRNQNREITLHEAYLYTDDWVDVISDFVNNSPNWNVWDIDQDTQVHPYNSSFVIIEEYKGG